MTIYKPSELEAWSIPELIDYVLLLQDEIEQAKRYAREILKPQDTKQ